jgi:hypothetical protein
VFNTRENRNVYQVWEFINRENNVRTQGPTVVENIVMNQLGQSQNDCTFQHA